MSSAITLFCLPYAGGSKYAYRAYEAVAPSFLKIQTLEYPGRGTRLNEPPLTDMHRLVDDLYDQVRTRADGADYALYGHSMGGLVASLLARKLLARRHRPPVHLFITGTTGPSAPSRKEKKRHLLGDRAFMDELKAFGGMPDEVLENEELLCFFLPILRADFQACENYFHERQPPLPVPLTVITGNEEDFETEEVLSWQTETAFPAVFLRMAGGHFFILNHIQAIMTLISRSIFPDRTEKNSGKPGTVLNGEVKQA